jgi:hypothetical protein
MFVQMTKLDIGLFVQSPPHIVSKGRIYDPKASFVVLRSCQSRDRPSPTIVMDRATTGVYLSDETA